MTVLVASGRTLRTCENCAGQLSKGCLYLASPNTTNSLRWFIFDHRDSRAVGNPRRENCRAWVDVAMREGS